MNQTETMQGKERIKAVFEGRNEDEKIMSLFLTAGYPDLDSTAELVAGFAENGTDMIELGMPFSDPLADGKTIQYSSEVAIENGVDMPYIFKTVRAIREKSNIPIILMGYVNPVMRYGVSQFCEEARAAGADGLIIPDVPVHGYQPLQDAAESNELAVIHLVAPNTTDARMKEVDRHSDGFVYCVSVTGVTGAREGEEVANSVERFIDRVNTHIIDNPKMVGFGIKTHEDAKRISEKADGFIVGSALIDAIRSHYPEEGWQEKVFEFVRTLKYGNSN